MCVKKGKLANVVFGPSHYEEEMDKLYSVSYASIAVLRDLEVAKSMRLSKIFPSLSCGVPVIYSGNGEAADVIRDNQCGVTVPPDDSPALADAIQQLAADGERRADLGRIARKFVESDYSWKIIVSRWIQEFEVAF